MNDEDEVMSAPQQTTMEMILIYSLILPVLKFRQIYDNTCIMVPINWVNLNNPKRQLDSCLQYIKQLFVWVMEVVAAGSLF